MTSDIQAIEHKRQQWTAAVNARDAHRYAQLMTEDIVWLPPGQPALSGRKAFESWVRPFFEGFRYEFSITDAEVQLAGDWAVERGTFHSKMEAQGGGPGGTHSGRYLVFWRRETDGTWRIERYLDETQAQKPGD